MGNRSRKIVLFKFNEYKDIEERLEKMAKKGLFLEKIGSMFWTFKKGEPKEVKYTLHQPVTKDQREIIIERLKLKDI